MKLFCFVFFVFCTTAKSSVPHSTVTEHLDLKDIDRNDVLWMTLFSRINTVLDETSKISEGLIILNKRLDAIQNYSTDLNKRLEAMDLKLTHVMENSQNCSQDLAQSQDELERKLSDFMNITETHFTELNQRQEAEELLSAHNYDPINNWTTILRRQDGSVDFNRNWTEYQKGFGKPDGEFFIGLERLHALTSSGAPQELIVILRDFKNEERTAKYDIFRIGNDTEKYAITELGTYSGDAGDSLDWHKGRKFSTYDQDNDTYQKNCAKNHNGGWWFAWCYHSHLFGPYKYEEKPDEEGVSWYHWGNSKRSLKFAEMKIRPKTY